MFLILSRCAFSVHVMMRDGGREQKRRGARDPARVRYMYVNNIEASGEARNSFGRGCIKISIPKYLARASRSLLTLTHDAYVSLSAQGQAPLVYICAAAPDRRPSLVSSACQHSTTTYQYRTRERRETASPPVRPQICCHVAWHTQYIKSSLSLSLSLSLNHLSLSRTTHSHTHRVTQRDHTPLTREISFCPRPIPPHRHIHHRPPLSLARTRQSTL